MSLIPARRNILILFSFLLIGSVQSEWSQYTPTNEIISNDIYTLGGCGDTLWLVSSKGVNYTASIIDSPIVWSGFNDVYGFNILYKNGIVLAFLQPNRYPNDIWQYNHQTNQYSIITLDYNIAEFDKALQFETQMVLLAVDATWFNNVFWIGCMDGGLAKLEPSGDINAIFYPGLNDSVFTFDSFLPGNLIIDSLNPPQNINKIIAVDSDDSLIWAACDSALWSFNPADTKWTRINDSLVTFSEYIDFELRSSGDTTLVYTIFINRSTDTTYHVFTYNSITNQWGELINEVFKNKPLSIELGSKGYIYLVDHSNNDITLYQQTSTQSIASKLDFNFVDRIRKAADDITNLSINDIKYSIHDNDTLFQIATDIGLFYSNNEHYDETFNIPFKYERRMVTVASGLGKTYVVPGIIRNPSSYSDTLTPYSIFVYNLSEDDYVTIDIYDYNMDHVINIFEEKFGSRWQHRKAGKHRTSGRSTVSIHDRWDGTIKNNNEKPVPPGVYFYRIKTKKGKRSFGKVIVARN